MPPPEIWGPPVWTLFHVLTQKINEEHFKILMPPLFNHMKNICSFLPCPECSLHARQFLSKINVNEIKTKTDFINIFYIFHNNVNKRKRKPLFNYDLMEKYNKISVVDAFNSFIVVYNTKGNLKLLTESFHRNMVLSEFKRWLKNHIKYFM